MRLIRLLTLRSLELNTRVFVKHVKTQDNGIADSLSWNQMARFRKLTKDLDMKDMPDQLPHEIWPIGKIWELDD